MCAHEVLEGLSQVLLQHIRNEDLPALLQLAVNSRSHVIASCMAEHISTMLKDADPVAGANQTVQQFSDPSFIEQLLKISLIRYHCSNVFETLVKLPGAQQLNADAVERLLQTMMQCNRSTSTTPDLEQLPAMQQLDSSTIMRLLQQAVHVGSTTAFDFMCRLPGAQHIPVDTVHRIVVDILKCRKYKLLEYVTQLRAAQLLETEVVSQAISECWSCGRDAVYALAELPAMNNLGAAARILEAAKMVNPSISKTLSYVTTEQLPAEVLVDAATSAILSGADQVLIILRGYAEVQQFSAETAAGVLNTAIKKGSTAINWVCGLPGAKQLTAEQVTQVIATALDWSVGPKQLDTLCALLDKVRNFQVADGLGSRAQVLETATKEPVACSPNSRGYDLVQAAIASSSEEGLKHLCQLPTVQQQLTACDVYRLLRLAIQMKQRGTVVTLCKLPAAGQLPSSMAEEIMLYLAQHGMFQGSVANALSSLCYTDMSSSFGAQLLEAACYKSSFPEYVNSIETVCDLPALRQYDDLNFVVKLLQIIIGTQMMVPASPIIGLPVMKRVDIETLQLLLDSAAKLAQTCSVNRYGKYGAVESTSVLMHNLLLLPAAQNLSSIFIENLLLTISEVHRNEQFVTNSTRSSPHNSGEVVRQLLALPEASGISLEVFIVVLTRALQLPGAEDEVSRWHLMESLCRFPVAAQLGKAQLMSILNNYCVQYNMERLALGSIFTLPAAKHLSMTELKGLRHSASVMGNVAAVRFLTQPSGILQLCKANY